VDEMIVVASDGEVPEWLVIHDPDGEHHYAYQAAFMGDRWARYDYEATLDEQELREYHGRSRE